MSDALPSHASECIVNLDRAAFVECHVTYPPMVLAGVERPGVTHVFLTPMLPAGAHRFEFPGASYYTTRVHRA